MQSVLSTATTSHRRLGSAQLSSRSSQGRCFTSPATPTSRRATKKVTPRTTTTTRALFSSKKTGGDNNKSGKKTPPPMSGKNLIKPKPLYAKGDEPWYIDPKTGKAPGYLQLTAFMASQLFVGLVMVPFSIWWQNVFDPFLNK